ncbi:MAG: hypothetical protein IKI99_01590 [Firmicutes bacterium]|nr:hypothetical protein [Bacillota bacterium]
MKKVIAGILGIVALFWGVNFALVEHASGEFKWTYRPTHKVYWITDGGEPADTYYELGYNDDVDLYYISHPGKQDEYITNTGKKIALDGEYSYLKDMPIVTSGAEDKDGNRKYYYIYADGSRAFDGKFDGASDFDGDYAETWEYDGGKTITKLIDKQGKTVYTIETKKTEFQHLKGNLYAEVDVSADWVKVIDVKTGKTVRTIEDVDCIAPVEEGYCLTRANDTQYYVDDDFNVLYDGKDIEKERGRYQGTWEGTDVYQKGRTYRNQVGDVILKLKKDEVAVYGEGKILVSDHENLRCYNLQGKMLFEKKLKWYIDDMWNVESGFFSGYENGMAVVTLDGDKWGIIDENGEMLTECCFDGLEIHGNGTILAAYHDKAGILAVK